MKVLILLFTVSLYAEITVGRSVQRGWVSNDNAEDSLTVRTGLAEKSVKLEYGHYVDNQIINLINYYDIYKAECYNDSVQVWRTPPQYYNNGATCDTIRYPVRVWVHKEPTFDGFMTWLKKLFGGKK